MLQMLHHEPAARTGYSSLQSCKHCGKSVRIRDRQRGWDGHEECPVRLRAWLNRQTQVVADLVDLKRQLNDQKEQVLIERKKWKKLAAENKALQEENDRLKGVPCSLELEPEDSARV